MLSSRRSSRASSRVLRKSTARPDVPRPVLRVRAFAKPSVLRSRFSTVRFPMMSFPVKGHRSVARTAELDKNPPVPGPRATGQPGSEPGTTPRLATARQGEEPPLRPTAASDRYHRAFVGGVQATKTDRVPIPGSLVSAQTVSTILSHSDARETSGHGAWAYYTPSKWAIGLPILTQVGTAGGRAMFPPTPGCRCEGPCRDLPPTVVCRPPPRSVHVRREGNEEAPAGRPTALPSCVPRCRPSAMGNAERRS